MTHAVVLAGGRSRRLGGQDKTALVVGDRSLLAVAVAAVHGLDTVVVVGPRRDDDLGRPVLWAREDPPFAGPVAALAAGIAALPRDADGHVVLLAADLPHAGALVSALLHEAPAPGRGRVVVDADGRPQWTAGLHPLGPLRSALDALATPVDASLHRLLTPLPWDPVPVDAALVRDVDTAADAAAVGARSPDTRADNTRPDPEETP